MERHGGGGAGFPPKKTGCTSAAEFPVLAMAAA